MVKYRSAAGEYAESLLERVAEDALLDSAPVREFRWYKGRQFYSGWYWSATTSRLVAYESRLELARILLADFDPAVTVMAAQPFQLSGLDGGRVRRHVPDLLLRNASGLVTVVDVKPRHRLDSPEVQAVFLWTERVVAARGWAFEVWSGTDATLLENVRFLAGYRRRATIEEGLLALALGLAGQCRTIGALEFALRPHAPASKIRPAILHLLWTGVLQADLSSPLATETAICEAEGIVR
jgi:hypothetical protein